MFSLTYTWQSGLRVREGSGGVTDTGIQSPAICTASAGQGRVCFTEDDVVSLNFLD